MNHHSVGSYFTTRPSIPPTVDQAAGTVNGAGVDVAGRHSTKLIIPVSGQTGTITAITATAKLEHSSDNGASDAWSDLSDEQVKSIDPDNPDCVEFNFDLARAKGFIRPVVTYAITGAGDFDHSGVLALDGGQDLPAT